MKGPLQLYSKFPPQGFNSVTEEMIELHPRNASANLLGNSPETQRNEGANQDEMQRLISKPDSELQNNLQFSQAVDQSSAESCISGSSNYNGLEGGMVGAHSKNFDAGGSKPTIADNCVRSSGIGNSIGVSKGVTRNGKIGNAAFNEGGSKLEDTGFLGNNLDDSMTVNLMIDTGEVGMKKVSSGVPDVQQKNDARGAQEPLISFHEVSELTKRGVIADEVDTINGSHITNFEVDPLGGQVFNDNSQKKTTTEKSLKVNYSNNSKGSKVSTSLLNSSSQDNCTEDKRHETML